MFGTLTLFRERWQPLVLVIPVLALTLIAPWVLGQDTDPTTEIRRQAEQGNASAQSYLGFMYETGEGVPQNGAEAVKWYRLAADQGDAVAQITLGLMYANGRGVLEDAPEAVKWLRLAADQGVAAAQFNLGVMYANGGGLPEDYVLGYAWLNLAATQGSETAREYKDDLQERMTAGQIAQAEEMSATLFDRINRRQNN